MLAFLAWTICAPSSRATIIDILTAADGDALNLVSIEVTSHAGLGFPNRVVSYEHLNLPRVTDYESVPENNAGNTITVLGTPSVEPPSGHNRLNLISDGALNTGIFNPSDSLPGLTLTFDEPLINGPGADLVIFELTVGTGQTPDPAVIMQANGSGTPRLRSSASYEKAGPIPNELTPTTWSATVGAGGRAGLDELLNSSLSSSAVTNAKWNAVPCDLDDLGVPLWQTVGSLAFLSGDASRAVDLLLIAGLPSVSVPGDYDRDGDNDGADFLGWQRAFGNLVEPYYGADGNGDGVIDAADYVVWRKHFGASVNTISDQWPVVAPEPRTAIIATLAALAAAAFSRTVRLGFHRC